MTDATTMDARAKFAIALQSPARVGAKDRDGWVGLFHRDGFVEDPVEAGRYAGTDRIGTFWDVFIGPQPSVKFAVKRDFCGGDTLVRQATVVSVTEADPNALLEVPALIRYRLREGKIGSLEAVWEPRGVIGWFATRGPSGWRALATHGFRMTTRVGLGNGMKFGGTLVGGLGHDRARAIVDGLRRGKTEALARARVTIGCGDDEAMFESTPDRALEHLRLLVGALDRLAVDQIVVCGNHVGAFLVEIGGPGALAVMLDADGHGMVRELAAIWEPTPRVLPTNDG